MLARDGWQCRACGVAGPGVRFEIDHIQRREDRPDLALDLDNLQVLCVPCHRDKTARETGRQRESRTPGSAAWADAINQLCQGPK